MEELANLPWHLIWPLFALQLILVVVSLIDLIRNRNTNGPAIMWVFIILFVTTIGPIIYFVFGRKQS